MFGDYVYKHWPWPKIIGRRENNVAQLGARIQTHLNEKCWKLADLHRESGIAKGYLSEILRSEKDKRPSAHTLYAIAAALGTTIEDLLNKPALMARPSAH